MPVMLDLCGFSSLSKITRRTGGLIGDAFAAAGWDVSEMLVVPAERYHSPDVR